MKNKTVVISDIHIGDDSDTCWYRTEVHEKYLTAVLQWVINNKNDIRELIILGDLVDFWTYPPNKVPPTMQEIVDKNPNTLGPSGKFTEVLSAMEGQVTYLRGNHDMSMTQKDLDKIGNSEHKIKMVPDVYIKDGVLYTHGHLDTLFNAPDNRDGRPYAPLPVGHFVTRALSYKIQEDGTRAVDLYAQGAPMSQKDWGPWLGESIFDFYKGITSISLEGIVASFITFMRKYANNMSPEEPIYLADGRSTTIEAVIAYYENLASDWVKDYGDDYDAKLLTYKSAWADKDGSYLGWFAQIRAMEMVNSLIKPYLVVMGHTHTPKVGLHNSKTDYLNTGFFCPSIRDMEDKGQWVTFGVIEHEEDSIKGSVRYSKKTLYKVTKDNYEIKPHTAEEAMISYAKVSESISGDFSSYLELQNDSKQALNRIQTVADYGHYVVPPPRKVEPKSKALFWLQDYPINAGSAGRVTYEEEKSGRLFTLTYQCPYLGIPFFGYFDNQASGGDALWTRSGSDKNLGPKGKVAEDGHPFFVNYEVNDWDGWTEWVGYTDVDNRDNPFVVKIPHDTYLVSVQIRDQEGYGVVNLGFLGTTDIHRTDLDKVIMPQKPSGYDGWVSTQRDVTTMFADYRCPKHAYIDAMMFAMVSGYGIVNVNCHHSDGSVSGWLTQNEPFNGKTATAVFPPKIQDGTWENAISGRIRHIQVREHGGDGIVDCRYQV